MIVLKCCIKTETENVYLQISFAKFSKKLTDLAFTFDEELDLALDFVED